MFSARIMPIVLRRVSRGFDRNKRDGVRVRDVEQFHPVEVKLETRERQGRGQML